MKVIFEQAEIEAAIIASVKDQIDVKEGLSVSVEIKAGRGENGLSAEISFVTPEASTPKPRATRTPKADKPAETPASTVVGATAEGNQGNSQSAETGTATDGIGQPAGEAGQVSGDASGDQSGDAAAAQADASQQASNEAQTEAPKKVSLFSNIKRPVNT
jgi:hypothetical protein